MITGYALLYSASSYMGMSAQGDSAFYLKRQIRATLVGLVGMVPVSVTDYRKWKKYAGFIYGFALFTVFLVLTPLGIENNGARRWVGFGGAQFQPAELIKIGVIILTAYLVDKIGSIGLKNLKTCYRIFSVSIVGAVLVIGLTSNLSSAIIIVGIGAVMVMIAGAGKSFVISMIAGGGIGITAILIISALSGKSFRISRILVWLEPEKYADSGGYQVIQGLYAIGSGGIFGKGLGNSAQKLGFVPEAANDMVFAIVCEELGIFGAIGVIVLFVALIRRMRIVASNAVDLYGSMLVVGILAQISIQMILNIAVVTNTIPNTGVSLPFISYGGTSLAFLMIEMGIVLSVSSHIRRIR